MLMRQKFWASVLRLLFQDSGLFDPKWYAERNGDAPSSAEGAWIISVLLAIKRRAAPVRYLQRLLSGAFPWRERFGSGRARALHAHRQIHRL